MKNLKNLLTVFAILICYINSGKADDVHYTLTAKNFVNVNSNTMEFDIYLKHANPGSSIFQYTGGQFVFYFNTSFANGGTLTYSFAQCNTGDSSDLPFISRPRRPLIISNQLFLVCNSLQTGANAPVVSSLNNGTKIIRMRIQTSASAFAGDMQLKWNNFHKKGWTTHIDAYFNNKGNIITDSTGHFIGNSGSITLNLNCIIQGFYYPIVDFMIRDTLNVYLRNTSAPFAIVDSGKTFLTTNGEGVINFVNASSGVYYIQVKHRNSIETWSKTGGETFTNGGTTSYDFTNAITQAFGSNMIRIDNSPLRFGIYNGDVNQDGTVDLIDASSIDNHIYNFASGYLNTDLDGNEVIDLGDAAIADNNTYNFVTKITPSIVLRP